ncbi:MAG TPA: amidohydrolase family protein [Polyangiaceae bacterium]|nr:amidohydrolase family protein [Polyangiaceae bacterium]
MRVDAHQHFWQPDRVEYAWMKPLTGEPARRLVRPVLPAELEPILAHHGVAQTVLVQAATDEAEADFLLSLAERHAFIAGAVVWLDMESTEFERQLAERATHPQFLGVRPMIQDIEDPEWMRRASVRRAFGALEEQQVCFDFLIKPHQLAATLEVLEAFPKLRAVIDHIAKPDIARGAREPWQSAMQRVSEHRNVYCKLSGMVTEADHERWTPHDLAPYIAHALACFGPERCMFGSDWPVCTLAASYERVVRALEDNLERLALEPAALSRIFGDTAREFYRLPAG